MAGKTDGSAIPGALTDRVREALGVLVGVREKRMFGGTTFMLNGNMLCCASGKGLMVRVGKEAESEALALPHAKPCLGAGRRMSGFVIVDPAGVPTRVRLDDWLARACRYVETLPAKEAVMKSLTPPRKRTTR